MVAGRQALLDDVILVTSLRCSSIVLIFHYFTGVSLAMEELCAGPMVEVSGLHIDQVCLN